MFHFTVLFFSVPLILISQILLFWNNYLVLNNKYIFFKVLYLFLFCLSWKYMYNSTSNCLKLYNYLQSLLSRKMSSWFGSCNNEKFIEKPMISSTIISSFLRWFEGARLLEYWINIEVTLFQRKMRRTQIVNPEAKFFFTSTAFSTQCKYTSHKWTTLCI